MIRKIRVNIPLGIHAGIASKLYSVTQKYNNHAYIKYKHKTASMNSMINVLGLGVCAQEEVFVIVDGDNEEQHMNELEYVLQHDER